MAGKGAWGSSRNSQDAENGQTVSEVIIADLLWNQIQEEETRNATKRGWSLGIHDSEHLKACEDKEIRTSHLFVANNCFANCAMPLKK